MTRDCRAPHPSKDVVKQLTGGDQSEEQFLDAMLDTAMAHLHKVLSPRRAAIVREVLTELLRTDPVLGELKRRTAVAANCFQDERSSSRAARCIK